VVSGAIICGMRNIEPERSTQLAQLAVDYRDRGVVGFDLAGAEADFPAKHHVEAFYTILNNNVNCTCHAGEGYGPESIQQALHYCGAHRIGHGTRLHEDPALMAYVNDHRIPLEICLTSNLQTNPGIENLLQHSFQKMRDAKLSVTFCTDNRTVSSTTVTDELVKAVKTFDLTPDEMRKYVVYGFKRSFYPGTYLQKRNYVRQIFDYYEALEARMLGSPGA